MSKSRDDFLQNHWFKYPESPRGALRFGRVHQLRVGNYNLADWTSIEGKQFTGGSLLADGDLVAILPAAQFILLAPNLTSEKAFFKLEDDPWIQKKDWFQYLQYVRDFFREKKFLEVKTPSLVKCPGTEPTLDVFETELVLGSRRERFYLTTSPELNLKKLLSRGAEKIFEIASVFRNGEKTDRHHFEFTMIEWYRAYANLSPIKHDVIELIEYVADKMKVARPKEVVTFTMSELFQKFCDFNLTSRTTLEELAQLAVKLHVDVKSARTIDDYFYLIFLEKIENQWPADRLVFVEKYPPYQAALARLDANGWGDRFEAYWNGLELANAYHELNDPWVQRQRSADDLEKKRAAKKSEVGLDETFFNALERGLPPSSGIALGLERLFMALMSKANISTLIS